MARSSIDQRALVAQGLRERLAEDGFLPAEVIRRKAEALGVTPRSIRRYVFEGRVPSGKRRRYVPTDREVEAYFETNGNIRRAHQLLHRDGFSVPSLSTFTRGLKRARRPDELAFAREGEAGRRRHQLYLRWEPAHRNEVWEVDHKELDVWIVADHRSSEKVRPSVIVFIDGASRAIMGLNLALSHTADDALAGLHDAVVHDPEVGPFHGVPDVLRFDNGLEFLAGAFTDALVSIGTQPWQADPYTPYQKGKVERLNRTFADEFCALLPGWSKAPRAANRKVVYGPNVPLLDMRTLERHLRELVRAYNNDRTHCALGGETPRQRWESDPTPVRDCARSELRWLLKRRETRKVQKEGIHFRTTVFIAPELNGLAGETVTIAYERHDLREIDVYRDGQFLCTARPQDKLTAEQKLEFLSQRREASKRASKDRRTASRRQGLRYVEAGLADPRRKPKRDATGKRRPARKLRPPQQLDENPLLRPRLDTYREEKDN